LGLGENFPYATLEKNYLWGIKCLTEKKKKPLEILSLHLHPFKGAAAN